MRSVSTFCLTILFLVNIPAGGQEKKEKESFRPTPREMELLKLLNAERKKGQVPLLKWNPVLTEVARGHSANMARQNKMEHDLDGKTPFDRIKSAGYRYRYAAENIAWGTPDIPLEVLVKGWMDSESHRKKLLNPNYLETGLGMAAAGDKSIYYTQVFGQGR